MEFDLNGQLWLNENGQITLQIGQVNQNPLHLPICDLIRWINQKISANFDIKSNRAWSYQQNYCIHFLELAGPKSHI